jgi:hypothetical protein
MKPLILITSIAGLLAARVLSDHFERVTIVEPESLDTDRRTRVGQWNQIHSEPQPISLSPRELMHKQYSCSFCAESSNNSFQTSTQKLKRQVY